MGVLDIFRWVRKKILFCIYNPFPSFFFFFTPSSSACGARSNSKHERAGVAMFLNANSSTTGLDKQLDGFQYRDNA